MTTTLLTLSLYLLNSAFAMEKPTQDHTDDWEFSQQEIHPKEMAELKD